MTCNMKDRMTDIMNQLFFNQHHQFHAIFNPSVEPSPPCQTNHSKQCGIHFQKDGVFKGKMTTQGCPSLEPDGHAHINTHDLVSNQNMNHILVPGSNPYLSKVIQKVGSSFSVICSFFMALPSISSCKE